MHMSPNKTQRKETQSREEEKDVGWRVFVDEAVGFMDPVEKMLVLNQTDQ